MEFVGWVIKLLKQTVIARRGMRVRYVWNFRTSSLNERYYKDSLWAHHVFPNLLFNSLPERFFIVFFGFLKGIVQSSLPAFYAANCRLSAFLWRSWWFHVVKTLRGFFLSWTLSNEYFLGTKICYLPLWNYLFLFIYYN